MATIYNDPNIIRVKDVLSFSIDGLGYMATSSMNEPIPEAEESITQLRIAKIPNLDQLDYLRCCFRIEADSLQRSELLFGSVIQLIHTPSEFYVVGTMEKDIGYDDEVKPCNIYLKKQLDSEFDISHKWIIMPRYKLRNEGDPVRNNDHIILRNAQHKHLVITSFTVSEEEDGYENLVGLDKLEHCQKKIGMKIMRILVHPRPAVGSTDEQLAVESDNAYIKGNDFIRIAHREYGGHLLCRLNDEKEIQSVVTPFGSVSRKSTAVKDHSHLVVVRPYHMQQPRVQHDFATSFSSLGIWQVILVQPVDDSQIQGKVKRGAQIRLRHAISGQYLAVRPALHADIDLVIPKRKKTQITSPRNESHSHPVEAVEEKVGNDEEEGSLDLESIKFGDDDESEVGASSFKITIQEAVVPDLKKMEWLGKNNPYLILSFGSRFKAQTDPIEDAQKAAKWDLSSNEAMQFSADDMTVVRTELQVSLMNKHSMFSDSLVGQGTVSIDSVRNVARNGNVELTLDLNNKRKKKVGVIKVTLNVERQFKDARAPQEMKVKEMDEQMLLKTSALRTSTAARPAQQPSQQIHFEQMSNSTKDRNFEWIVATTSTPNEFTLFTIHALNIQNRVEDPFLRYEDNIYFESGVLKHRFQLLNPSQFRSTSKWWEYKEDARLDARMSSMEDYIVDSEVFLLEKAPIEEVQDTIYACKLLPLARAATVTLQLTPSVGFLYTPLFRHFKKYLNTLSLWCLGLTDNDGSLLPEEGNYDHQKSAQELNNLFVEVEMEEANNNPLDMLNKSFRSTSDLDDIGEEEGEEGELNQSPEKTILQTPSKSATRPKIDKSKHGFPSMYPWLGRKVGTDFYSQSKESSLEKYVEYIVDDITKTTSTNPVMMRRQSILFDTKLMEQLMHFLNVFFILQRAISYSQSTDVLAEYAGLPLLVQQCTFAVHQLLNAAVHCNEVNALKLLSVRGTLLSLISQKILGWSPPLESIVKIAFESSNDSSVDSSDGFKLEDVLINSITSSDIRQILEQMGEMNNNGDTTAANMLSLLTLLCQAGKAKKYFQNILVRSMFTCDPEVLEFSPNSSFARGKQFNRAHDSLLFKTDYQNNEWMVQFQSTFVLPPQESRNQEEFKKELLSEGESLRMLFYHYNSAEVDNDVLDLEECFLLLEDLGFGGPFLYEEIGRLMGTNIWGFLLWWCYRCSFYYPSSSVSHSQISPIQAMKLIDPNLDEALIMCEFNRRSIDRESIMRSLRFQSIISSRIPGFKITFNEKKESSRVSFYFRAPKRQASKGRVNPIRKMKTSRLKEKLGPQFREWVHFHDAFTNSSALWFRQSLSLLAALCEDSNSLCQRVVSVLLPAECVLHNLLNPDISSNDKSILCDILNNVYVENSFVFPTRCIPVRRSALFCAFGEDIQNPNVSVGKLFNPLSRVCYDEPSFEEGSALRARLFEFIKEEASKIAFYSTNFEAMSYTRSLLTLFRKLLHQGFFGESSFEFLDFIQSSSRTYFFQSEGEISLERPSTLKEFELLVMTKLIECKEIHREQQFNEDEKGSGDKNNDTRQKKENLKTKNRKKFLTILDDITKLDKIFTDPKYTSLIHSAIAALGEFMEIRQMYRVQRIWDHIGQYASKFSLLCYTNDWPSLEKCFEDKNLYSIFDDLITEKVDEKTFIDAVMMGVLHPDKKLIGECLHLLDSRLSLYHGVYELVDITTFLLQPSHSLINRFISFYFKNVYHSVEEIIDSPNQERNHIFQLMDFFIENILSLLYKTDLEKFSASLGTHDGEPTTNHSRKRDYTHDTAQRFNKDREKIIFRNISSMEIPCPVGEDDFFLLDLKAISANEIELQRLMDQYSESQINYKKDVYSRWLIDAKVTVRKFTESFFSLLNHYLINYFSKSNEDQEKPNFQLADVIWEDIPTRIQVIMDKVFSFLAILWKDYDSLKFGGLPREWFPQTSDLLLALYPDCNGAAGFLHTVIQHSTDEHLYFDLRTIESLSKRLNSYPSSLALPVRFRLMLALVSSKNQKLIEKGSSFIVDSLGDYFMTKFRMLEMIQPQQSPDSYASLAYQIIQPIYLSLTSHDRYQDLTVGLDRIHSMENPSMRGHNPYLPPEMDDDYDDEEDDEIVTGPTDHLPQDHFAEEIETGLTMFCSHDMCKMLLENSTVHLQVKAFIIRIALKLYTVDEFPLEELILKEIRRLRLFYHLLQEESKKRDLIGLKNFIFVGIFPYLKFRILETKILTMEVINSFIVAELTNYKGIFVNKAVAQEVTARLMTHFPHHPVKPSNKRKKRRTASNNPNPYDEEEGDDDAVGLGAAGESGASYLPSEIISCLMIILNIFSYHDAQLMKDCSPQEKKEMIWISSAILLFLTMRSEFIFDRNNHNIIDMKQYEKVKDRLKEIVEGLLLEYLSFETEFYLKEYFFFKLLHNFKLILKSSFEITNSSSNSSGNDDFSLSAGTELLKSTFHSMQSTIASSTTNHYLDIIRNQRQDKILIPNKLKTFKLNLNIAITFDEKFLKNTPLFHVLQEFLYQSMEFIDRGGMALYNSNENKMVTITSRSFAQKFAAYSTFDLWLKGEGRYLSNIFLYLGNITEPIQFQYNFLHLFSLLLSHKIESIQENPLLSTNYRLSLIQTEQERLHKVQDGLSLLGCLDMCIKVFGRSYTSNCDDYIWKYTPLMLKIATELTAWQNKPLQEEVLNVIENAILSQKPPERYCLVGLQRLLRKSSTEIVGSISTSTESSANKIGGGPVGNIHMHHHPFDKDKSKQPSHPFDDPNLDQTIMKILRVSIYFCSFAGALCSGDNTRSQQFLVAQPSRKILSNNRLIVDLTQDLCILVNAVIVRLTNMISYLKNETFMNRLAPFIYENKDTQKRRFVAWHDTINNNFPIMIYFIYSLSIIFENCIGICSKDSVHAVLKALPKTPDLLEFLGVLQLTTTSTISSSSLIPGLKHNIKWQGGSPLEFYTTLLTEMKKMGAYQTDGDYIEFALTYRKWMDIIQKNTTLLPSFSSSNNDNNENALVDMNTIKRKKNKKSKTFSKFLIDTLPIDNYFHLIFGCSYSLLMKFVKQTENKCLRLILSSLEVSNYHDSVDLIDKFSDSILIQNLDSSFKKLSWSFGRNMDLLTSTTVAYVSLIESIGRVHKETDNLLTEWDSSYSDSTFGKKPKSIYGSVELIGDDGRIRRLYFPIPSFVSQFWPYPEVQKIKEAVVYEVIRTSPEEKIGDFYYQMNRIITVMKRQERLRLMLTYFIHSIFGGKSIPYGDYLPKQNNFALILTLGLNVYYVYYHTNPFSLPPLSGDYIDIFAWDTRTYVVMIVEWVHFLLWGAFAFRTILNSSAADDIQLFDGDSMIMKFFSFLIRAPYALLLILHSAIWPLFLTGCSFWAMYNNAYWLYVPCLLDVTFQFEIMNFLFIAISRNVFRIGATLFLAFLCLYFYAILAYLYIGSQYNLGGYSGCHDPGSCFKLHLDYGLQNSPNWDGNGYIAPNFGLSFPYAHQFSYVVGTAYNLTYVIIINLVLQALISGLIIDTFSQMRQEREDTQKDIDTKCFICSISRDEFEQVGISYIAHIKEEHNMWHYLWFKLYLDLKDPLGFSTTENFANRNFADKQTFVRMIPVKRSLSLESVGQQDNSDEGKELQEIEHLKQMIERLQENQLKMRENLENISYQAMIEHKRINSGLSQSFDK